MRYFQLWRGGFDVRVRPVSSAELRLPVDASPVLTQGSIYIPVDATDDVDAVWAFAWENITLPEIEDLLAATDQGRVTLADPLGLNCVGYLTNVQYQGRPGMLDSDTGLPLYNASCEFHVIRLQWQPFIPVLASGGYDVGSQAGISATGDRPLTFRGEASTYVDDEGWIEVQGGDVDPWNTVVPPIGEVWRREPRVYFPPGHGVAPRWLELRGQLLPPARGSVFFAFKPFEFPEEEEPGGPGGSL